MQLFSSIKKLKDTSSGYWHDRIAAQLIFMYNLSRKRDLHLEERLEKAVSPLMEALMENGCIGKKEALSCERALCDLSHYAKEYTAHLVAHAHIDMNWMWGYQETVSVTLSTLRTILSFMEEYPSFTFSQSQASVYEIVEKYAPEMLSEIKARIKEGRWEVSAGTWVEHDKNMSGTEAQIRQVLEAKKYLSCLLDIPKESLEIDFEPDTFGHCECIPEILAECDIKYYYHCRANCENTLYNWTSPSGATVLAYRDPKWYTDGIDAYILADMPLKVCDTGVFDILNVYGVGDHGGGPTRKDIETALDMTLWPLYPKTEFSTYHRYFKSVEPYRDSLPTVSGEQNFIFTGCYTSQSRIKSANAVSEARLYDGECLTAIANSFAGHGASPEAYTVAWRKALFNQFHDILPGSGVALTREHALGSFQDTLALCNSEAARAISAISRASDTSHNITDPFPLSESEGGGAGYFASPESSYICASAERGRGNTRIIQLFNTTGSRRTGAERIVIFDYEGDLSRLEIRDSEKRRVPFTLGETKRHYWRHYITEIYIDADVPPFGYETYTVTQKDTDSESNFKPDVNPRLHSFGDCPVVLENDLVCATFDPVTYALSSFTDKRTGSELCRGGGFDFIEESLRRGESSWAVGQYMQVKSLHTSYKRKFLDSFCDGMRSVLRYEVKFENSIMTVTLTLKKGSTTVDARCDLDWLEGKYSPDSVPALRFAVDLPYSPESYTYSAAAKTIERPSLCHDVPSLGFAYAKAQESGFVLVCPEKYGYRGNGNTLSLTLVRSSSDPDPYPELARHSFSFSFGAAQDKLEAYRIWDNAKSPLIQHSATPHAGALKGRESFIFTEGAQTVSVKSTEDGMMLRLINIGDTKNTALIGFIIPPKKAYICKADETEIQELDCTGGKAEVNIVSGKVMTLKLIF